MNAIQANGFIAEELLGWYEYSEDEDMGWYKEGEWKAKIGWNPCKNLKEAWDAADKLFEEALVRKRSTSAEGTIKLGYLKIKVKLAHMVKHQP